MRISGNATIAAMLGRYARPLDAAALASPPAAPGRPGGLEFPRPEPPRLGATQRVGEGAVYARPGLGPIVRELAASLGRADAGAPQSAAQTAPPDRGPLTVEGLMKVWGQSDPDYDLNGDQVVNVQDLVQFITNWPASATPQAPPAAPVDTSASLTVQGLMAAWGQSGSSYDLNSDGTVNVQDLTKLYEMWPMPHTGGGLIGVPQGALPMRLSQLDALADTFVGKLAAAGFSDRPPANVAQLVDGLRLDAPSRQYVFARVAERFPNGLGVNLVA